MTQQTISLSEVHKTKIAIADLVQEIDYLKIAIEVNLIDYLEDQLINAQEHLESIQLQQERN